MRDRFEPASENGFCLEMPRYVIGGAGYIGSHVCAALLEKGIPVVVVDDFSTGLQRRVQVLQDIDECQIVEIDILDTKALAKTFRDFGPGPVYHFAALKDAGASVSQAETYTVHNTQLLLSCLDAMADIGLRSIIYSSTAAIYGEPDYLPIDSRHVLKPSSPYGASKLICENILQSTHVRDRITSVILRYFNPVGCGSRVELGYDYATGGSVPIFPAIARAIMDASQKLTIHKSPQPTHDGTTVRDFVHVSDLADAHVEAEKRIGNLKVPQIFNLGTGNGISIHEVLSGFEKVLGHSPSYKMAPPRPGDVSQSFCDFGEAFSVLKWRPRKTIEDMCLSEIAAARSLIDD